MVLIVSSHSITWLKTSARIYHWSCYNWCHTQNYMHMYIPAAGNMICVHQFLFNIKYVISFHFPFVVIIFSDLIVNCVGNRKLPFQQLILMIWKCWLWILTIQNHTPKENAYHAVNSCFNIYLAIDYKYIPTNIIPSQSNFCQPADSEISDPSVL